MVYDYHCYLYLQHGMYVCSLAATKRQSVLFIKILNWHAS